MLTSLAADHVGTARFFRFDLPSDATVRRHEGRGCQDFGEPEFDLDAVVDLVASAVRS